MSLASRIEKKTVLCGCGTERTLTGRPSGQMLALGALLLTLVPAQASGPFDYTNHAILRVHNAAHEHRLRNTPTAMQIQKP